LTVRVIPCLDIDKGRVVKGTEFKRLKDAGDPVKLAKKYNFEGADELTFLDITATNENRNTVIQIVEKVSSVVFIPLTVGGGIGTIDDMRKLLRAGADKVAVCSAVFKNPDLITNGAKEFGSQCIVVSIDAKKVGSGKWEAFVNGGRVTTGKDVVELAVEVAKKGAGEILLNSIDGDGSQQGYDLELLKRVSDAVRIPVIASGGAGNPEHMVDGVKKGNAAAVLAASILHYGQYSIRDIKRIMKEKEILVR